MMKVIFSLLCLSAMTFASDTPSVEVYWLRQFNVKADDPSPTLVMEVANTTKQTLYIKGATISSPLYQEEALREGKWQRVPQMLCGTGMLTYPLRPGSRMLVEVGVPFDERSFRYRFFFFSSEKDDAQVVEVVSRAIESKEFGDQWPLPTEKKADQKEDHQKDADPFQK